MDQLRLVNDSEELPRNNSVAVVCIGGNAVEAKVNGERVPFHQETVSAATQAVLERYPQGDGQRLVIVHGNGPQYGAIAKENPDLTSPEVVRETQKRTGDMIKAAIGEEAEVAIHNTEVIVDAKDLSPKKEVGAAFAPEDEDDYEKTTDTLWVKDGIHYRVKMIEGKVHLRELVPSPEPTGIHGIDALRDLVQANAISVICGGGGIPVLRTEGGIEPTDIKMVIDKDLAGAQAAIELGAESFEIVTAVPGLLDQENADKLMRKEIPDTELEAFFEANIIKELTLTQAREKVESMKDTSAEGCMLPKLQACINYVEATGNNATITSIKHLNSNLKTTIVPDPEEPEPLRLAA